VLDSLYGIVTFDITLGTCLSFLWLNIYVMMGALSVFENLNDIKMIRYPPCDYRGRGPTHGKSTETEESEIN